MFDLSNLSPSAGATKARKRKGRGVGSGLGKTAGRGHKGQKSRSGGAPRVGFEGGQMPLSRRLPKRGFYNRFRTNVIEVNVEDLERFEVGTIVDEAALKAAGLIKGDYTVVKLLGNGDIEKALTLRVHRVSASARLKVEGAGGTIEVIGG
ncbi:MAG: 50S ribosomal protein L15 [Deltaproteobacteria bacterium CG2_30_63_29]|nr:MAG: 50S ribosomal protein L15 [Deltaproteobacteria bacterium CG2_30_63_29]PIW02131.1 MAG: 50S ribosomal protein L15 [Deltaproteobacteria bacterium CG17_big_fil_post_rev_8_21_14_2_50_63_7]PJB35133.1 MAG: 50S ribosomal protein L15 [Deltaproteobacteria bacterium CG_4_9_14_3_um_filter_63_12]